MVVPNDAALLSGLNIETQLGSLVGLGSAVQNLTGQAITGSTGTLAPADVMGLTGVSATASTGTLDPADQVIVGTNLMGQGGGEPQQPVINLSNVKLTTDKFANRTVFSSGLDEQTAFS